jgi:Polysaccharide lyase family 8, super-sandwich domain
LDQRRHSGPIYVDNDVFDAPGNETFDRTVSSLWHGGVGYYFDPGSTVLSLSVGERTGAWSAIGTSTQPPETVDLFAAWIEHQDLTQPVSYTIFPGSTFDSFRISRARIVRSSHSRMIHIYPQFLTWTTTPSLLFSGKLWTRQYYC